MTDNALYPYASGDLLEQPNTYFYTPFHGDPFIDAWRQCRRMARTAADPIQPSQHLAAVADASDQVVMINLLHELLAGRADHDYWWPRLIKKFEVRKRLFEAYETEPPHRAVTGSQYQNLDVYLLFAEWLCQSCQQGQLQCINTLLKVMDSLLSQQHALSPHQQASLNWLIDEEQAVLQQLMDRVMA
jgi:hypothetical protein